MVSFIIATTTVLTGCAQFTSKFTSKKQPESLEAFVPEDLNSKSQREKYVAKIESFVIILDASASMEYAYEGSVDTGHSKFEVARDILLRMNDTLPDVDIKSALVTFGHGFFTPLKKTYIIYELTQHSRSLLKDALSGDITPQGSSPAGDAIEDAWRLLAASGGKNAVIFISDGEELRGYPVTKVKDLKEMYGDRICFYAIHVGNTPEGKDTLRELVRTAKCGFTVSADEIASSEGMANFVKEVFLTAIMKKDSDGDGVYDDDDECPDTPKGAIVDSRGCWVVKDVTFEYKKWDIREDFDSILKNIVEVLGKNPDMKIRIDGHTDNIGSMGYNMDLSRKRAQAIKNYLVEHGINASRISTEGFAYTKPIATNDTEAGRSLNRRAEIVPIK